MLKTYSELRKRETLKERYEYLRLSGIVGEATFGYDRYINQKFYTSREWRLIRNRVIVRDKGCDLGVDGNEIQGSVYIHHMNPMTASAIVDDDPTILNPEYLIAVTHRTHNAIHYGDASQLPQPYIERKPGDTKLW